MQQEKSKRAIWVIAVSICALGCTELLVRYRLGLGTPPLSIPLPRIEYMSKPNQDVFRFGNRVIINQYGMRSEPFSAVKSRDEYRIMVFGDSVVNGGAQTDHAQLATSRLKARLAEEMKRPVTVGNVSAGSWGPGNWLAYAEEYGFFEADEVVLVVSSHDFADNPTFEKLNESTHPTKNPPSALIEGITRYLPRYLPTVVSVSVAKDKFPGRTRQESERGLGDLKKFLNLALANCKNVTVIQHWEKSEIESGRPGTGYGLIKKLADSIGVETISLEDRFRRSILNGSEPYRDNVHPNQVGQLLIYDALYEVHKKRFK